MTLGRSAAEELLVTALDAQQTSVHRDTMVEVAKVWALFDIADALRGR
jgi:hypothetical protein